MLFALFILLLVVFVALPLFGAVLSLVLGTLLIGLVVGLLGRLVLPGRTRIGLLATLVFGIGGALVGSAVGGVLDTGTIATFLLQVAAAAGGIAVLGSSGRALGGSRRRGLTR